MKHLRTLVIVIVALAVSHNAMAWGKWGHRIGAYIAEQHLTEKANSECRRYLKHSLPYFSSWQDYWRNCDGFQEMTHWHSNYLNPDNTVGGKKGVPTRDASYQIARIVKEMEGGKYRNLPDSIVMDNLKLLIHMVVDMHCPSHTNYHKDTGYPLKKPIYVNGKKYARHTFWDASPQLLHPKWKIERFQKEYDTYSAKQIKKIVKGDPTKWVAQNVVKLRPTFDMYGEGQHFESLSKKQLADIEAIMSEQLAYAGYRLSHILNEIFK